MRRKIFFVVLLVCILITGFNHNRVQNLSAENNSLKQLLQQVALEQKEDGESRVILTDPDRGLSTSADHSSWEIQPDDGMDSRMTKADVSISNGYLMIIDALKNEVALRSKQVEEARAAAMKDETGYGLLSDTLQQKETALAEVRIRMARFNERKISFERKLLEADEKLRLAEADLYYEKGQVAEAHARKIRFAPAKKREHLMEALEVYKKSFYLGKQDASHKIAMLEKSLSGRVKATRKNYNTEPTLSQVSR